MGENRDPLLAGLPHRVREQTASRQAHLRHWWADLREGPLLLWRTTPVRVVVWLILGICALVTVRSLSRSMLPVGGEMGSERATALATLYVACASPDFYGSYATRQPADFDAWPLTWRKCGQQSVYRAELCPKCRRWYATVPGTPKACPHCAVTELAEPMEFPETGPANPDDAEDGW